MINDVHGTGHWGIIKTYNGVKSLFWWPGLFTAVTHVISGCQVYQMLREVNPHKLDYHPLETVHRPREVVYMDLLGTGHRDKIRILLHINCP